MTCQHKRGEYSDTYDCWEERMSVMTDTPKAPLLTLSEDAFDLLRVMSTPRFDDTMAVVLESLAEAVAEIDAQREARATAEAERDEAMNQLRTIVRGLPSPPWFESEGGSDWEPWCEWLTKRVAEAASAEAERDALREQVRALTAWRPMETAPENTLIVLWWPYWTRRPQIGQWSSKVGHWIAECALDGVDDTQSPEGWLPLPAPPAEDRS